jgi:transposase
VELSPETLEVFFDTVQPHLDERQRRVVAGAMAEALGRGGQVRVATASKMSTNTLWRAVTEVREGIEVSDRVRRPGGGDKPAIERQPELLSALDDLVHPDTRGNPMSLLRWTSKSTYELARELTREGYSASAELVRRLLHQMGYSLQAPAKEKEGTNHPDRDAQFSYLNDQASSFMADDQPVVSVDTKKKELVGEYANKGREWQPTGEPDEVLVHDFIDPESGKAVPYGVFDVANNEGWVSVGDNADTAGFARLSRSSWNLRWRSPA